MNENKDLGNVKAEDVETEDVETEDVETEDVKAEESEDTETEDTETEEDAEVKAEIEIPVKANKSELVTRMRKSIDEKGIF